jgi:TM2 domain-containing membrane protein YozV
MPTVVCPGCGRRISLREEEMAFTIQCETCGTQLKPAAAARPERASVTCPACQAQLRIPAGMVGKGITCPECHRAFQAIPEAEAVPAREAPRPASGEAAPMPAESPGRAEERACPYCGELIKAAARKCRYCGEVLDPVLREVRGRVGGWASATDKRILPAFLLCFFLGSLGLHRFYVGKTGSGVAMLVLFVVGIPACFVFVGFLMILAVSIWAFVDMIIIICGAFTDGDGYRITEWT